MKRLGKLTAMLLSFVFVTVMMMTSVFAEQIGDMWEDQWVKVQVIAAGKHPTNRGLRRGQAKTAAELVARRELLSIVQGVAIESFQQVTDLEYDQDVITGKVSGVSKGARTLECTWDAEDNCILTMGIPLYGNNSVASAVMKALPQPERRESFPEPVPNVVPSTPQGAPTYAENTPSGKAFGNYTGLIIDCRGKNLRPAMNAIIMNDQRQPIYGYKNLDIDKVISNGMIGYAYDTNNVARTGSNPLIIKAVAVDNNSSAIVSTADANRILIENERTKFLDNTAVVFVRDR